MYIDARFLRRWICNRILLYVASLWPAPCNKADKDIQWGVETEQDQYRDVNMNHYYNKNRENVYQATICNGKKVGIRVGLPITCQTHLMVQIIIVIHLESTTVRHNDLIVVLEWVFDWEQFLNCSIKVKPRVKILWQWTSRKSELILKFSNFLMILLSIKTQLKAKMENSLRRLSKSYILFELLSRSHFHKLSK